MRTLLLLASALALASLAACSKGGGTIDVEKLPCDKRTPASGSDGTEGFVQCSAPKEAVELGKFTCKKGTTVSVYEKAKTLRECWVATPVTVDDATCTGGVTLYPDGKLLRCQLDAALKKNGVDMPKGAWITFTPSGAPKRIELPQGGTLGAYKCKGYWNYVYESGKPKKCELADAATIGGAAKKAGETVCFDEGGKLVECSTLKFN
jgi:hypothetical protein